MHPPLKQRTSFGICNYSCSLGQAFFEEDLVLVASCLQCALSFENGVGRKQRNSNDSASDARGECYLAVQFGKEFIPFRIESLTSKKRWVFME